MFTQTVARTPVRVLAAEAPRPVELALGEFRPTIQPRVRALAARHPWIADLAVSFPALLFALALPRRGQDAARAERMTREGAPLARIADVAGVPLWLRAAPPRAFKTPIPVLPDTPEFRRRIANHFPKRWADAPKWLSVVADAARWADEDVALWAAREAPLRKPRRAGRYYREKHEMVWLWSWFSKHPETRAGRVAAPAWNADLQWSNARDRAYAWTTALQPALWMGDAAIEDMWLEPMRIGGYTFAPLRTAADMEAESVAMLHCAATYADRVAFDEARLWSVRKDGERVATIRLARAFGSPFVHIDELAGVSNQPVPHDMWLAARWWIHTEDGAERPPRAYKTPAFDTAAWRALFKPYWLAKRAIPSWLPLTPKVYEYSVF